MEEGHIGQDLITQKIHWQFHISEGLLVAFELNLLLPHHHPHHLALSNRLSRLRHLPVEDQTTFSWILMRFITDAVMGPPGHGELSVDCRPLDHTHHEVAILYASVSHLEVDWPSAWELIDNGDAHPIVDSLLEGVAIELYIVVEEWVGAIDVDGCHSFLLGPAGERNGRVGAITAFVRPTTTHNININKSYSLLLLFASSVYYCIFVVIVIVCVCDMNNSQQLILSLQEYIVQLQTENRSLKQHIFQLQGKVESSSVSFHDEIEKLKVYIDHCQNEIIKRETRQVSLLELLAQMEAARQEICRERDIYIQQIDELRKDLQRKQQEVIRLQHQEEGLRGTLALAKNTQSLPPKSAKCRNCEAYVKNQEVLQRQIAERQHVIRCLQGDIECLKEFI